MNVILIPCKTLGFALSTDQACVKLPLRNPDVTETIRVLPADSPTRHTIAVSDAQSDAMPEVKPVRALAVGATAPMRDPWTVKGSLPCSAPFFDLIMLKASMSKEKESDMDPEKMPIVMTTRREVLPACAALHRSDVSDCQPVPSLLDLPIETLFVYLATHMLEPYTVIVEEPVFA